MDEALRSLAKQLRLQRNIRGLTQAQVAEILGIEEKYYASVENSRRSLRLSKLVGLCRAYHITLNDLIDLSDTAERESVKEKNKDDILKALDKLSAEQVDLIKLALTALTK